MGRLGHWRPVDPGQADPSQAVFKPSRITLEFMDPSLCTLQLSCAFFGARPGGTNTWCYQQPGGPHVSSAPTPLLRPTAPRKLCTRHAPRTAPTPNFLLAPPVTVRHCQHPRLPRASTCSPRRRNGQERARASRQEQRQEHREGIAPGAPGKATRQVQRSKSDGRRGHEDQATNPSPTRRQPVTNSSPARRHCAKLSPRPPAPPRAWAHAVDTGGARSGMHR